MELIAHWANLQTVKTVASMALHSTVTLPSVVFHSIYNKYAALTYCNTKKIPKNGKNIVLLVHGRNGNPADFSSLIANMTRVGIEIESGQYVMFSNYKIYALDTVNLGNTSYTSVEEDAQTLKCHIDKYYRNCSITLVGLSKGGLVILRHALNHLSTENVHNNHIDKLVTMSSPVRGTLCASLFPPSSSVFQNLSYECNVVQELAHCHHRLNIYHIVPTWDHLIVPASCAKFENADESHVYTYNGFLYGHTGIAFSQEVAMVIVNWLKE